jgi:hypothetical protein
MLGMAVTAAQPFRAFAGILQSTVVHSARLPRRSYSGYSHDRGKRNQLLQSR